MHSTRKWRHRQYQHKLPFSMVVEIKEDESGVVSGVVGEQTFGAGDGDQALIDTNELEG